MADEQNEGQVEEEAEASAREAFDRLTAEQQRDLLAGDRLEELSAEEILSRLSVLDSGDVIGHDEVVAGLARELSAQQKVIGLLSDQREPEGLNIAKVLDSSSVDIGLLMQVAVQGQTADIIGPKASADRRKGIQKEISLPNMTAFQMCLKSVLIRIGRVAITASGIFLGIAFYASVQMTALVLKAAGEATAPEDQARQVWLIVMALMVAVVGICNSMLMAVAERFQEIGTMKCLGALDQFIVKLFLIESGLLGFLAGLLGGLVGMGLMYVTQAFRYTFHFQDVASGMLGIMLWSIVLGTILSVIAAILPANQAAKMPAAAALRTAV